VLWAAALIGMTAVSILARVRFISFPEIIGTFSFQLR
jgi:hypothetical protein